MINLMALLNLFDEISHHLGSLAFDIIVTDNEEIHYYVTESSITEYYSDGIIHWMPFSSIIVSDDGRYQMLPSSR